MIGLVLYLQNREGAFVGLGSCLTIEATEQQRGRRCGGIFIFLGSLRRRVKRTLVVECHALQFYGAVHLWFRTLIEAFKAPILEQITVFGTVPNFPISEMGVKSEPFHVSMRIALLTKKAEKKLAIDFG